MKRIWDMFTGGLAWLVLGSVLLCGVFVFVEVNVTQAHSAVSVPPRIEVQAASDAGFATLDDAEINGFDPFTSPALMSYGLAALVFLWTLYNQHQNGMCTRFCVSKKTG